jgi:hypothetical protein
MHKSGGKRQVKKAVFIILLCLCSLRSYASFPQGGFGIEMTCGYDFTAFANFNSNFTEVFNRGYLDGYGTPKKAHSIPGLLEADVKLRYNMMDGLPAFIRLGFLRLEATEVLQNSATKTEIAVSTASLNVAYAGAGMKYGFKITGDISLFISADGGCFIPVYSYWEVTGNTAENPPVNNTPGPDYNAYQKIDFADIFFGGNACAGMEWQLSRSWGIIMGAGYRLAKTPVTYTKTGIFARNSFDFTELDFSGPYATAGLVLYFGGK